MDLSNLRPAEGSKHSDNFRRGRGHGSGNGKTAGKGHKGQKARSGGTRPVSYTHLDVYKRQHFDKAGVSSKRFVREFKFENAEEFTLAQEIKADIFAAGDKVDATAISKGKGFQGAIKRHNQHRGPMTHGSKFHRHAGSNGAASDPSKVFKGKRCV